MNSVDENDSIWLFDVLEDIGVNDKFRKTCQQSSIQQEILTTFNAIYTCYMFGGSCEGTITPGGTYDSDGMLCDDRFPVVDDLRKTYKDIMSFFIVTEPHTPAGYVKLQVASQGKPLTSEWWHAVVKVGYSNRFKLDNCGRLLMTGPHAYMTNRSPSFCSFAKNKPTIKTNFIETGMSDLNISYRCQTWPTIAQEWLARPRSYGWPTKDTIQELKSLGFFVVRKGHPSSRDKDLEWRISFTLQERKLMFNLTDVEHKCYIVLKMLNRDIIDINYLSSFHWKTCLFYVIEDNMRDVWKKERIFKCIELCIRQMLKWVKEGICPNYFIPKDNLFDERIDVIGRFKATQILEKILKEGFSSLLRVTTSNLCDYIKTRNYSEMYQCHANSKNNYERAVYNKKVEVIKAALTVYHYEILKCYKADECITNFIEFLWRMVDKIEKSGPIAEHTKDETKLALSFLKPFVYTCLASIISAMVINNSNLQVRDFLLLGSFTYFMKGDLPGRLKFISVLYAIGLYTDCEWFLDQLNEEHIKCNPSVCLCNDIERGYLGGGQIQTDESCLKVNTCVTFLQTEIPITPNALKYEMFKYFGIPLQENEVTNIACYRRNRAFVDSNIYFLLIKYLIKTKLGGVNAVDDFESDFVALIGENVKHLDVGYNLFAWIIHNGNFMNTPRVLYSLQQSYKRMDASDIGSLKEKLKPKQNQFNSVIIRTLVVLYDTWIAREPYFIVFCFHCFKVATLKTCSVCKKARYCSRRCQRKNWNIHKAVCEIVRSCHSF